jgi:hypothetical protein
MPVMNPMCEPQHTSRSSAGAYVKLITAYRSPSGPDRGVKLHSYTAPACLLCCSLLLNGCAMRPASVTFATGNAWSGGYSASSTAMAVSVPTHGNGLVNIHDDARQFIRCVFDLNALSNTGLGECRRNDGRQYDLRITR